MNGPLPEKRLSLEDLAQEFRVTKRTVLTWIKEGCPHLRARRMVWVKLSEVETWMRFQGKDHNNATRTRAV